MEERFYSKGLRFECSKCSDCCRLSPGFVYLSKNDLTKLCLCFRMSEEEFVKKYCRFVQYYGPKKALCLRETADYDCVLWKSGKGCLAYEARPVQCRTYPFWPWILKSREAWEEEGRSCRGIGRGRLYSASEIEEKKLLCESNSPVTQKSV